MSDRLDRKSIPWPHKDYGAERTYETIKKPFSKRFAYWAGRNGKTLRQTNRIDEAAALAFAEGWQVATDELNKSEVKKGVSQ